MINFTTLIINCNFICKKAEWYWLSKGEEKKAELVRTYNFLLDCKIRKGWDSVLDEKKAAVILGCKPEEVENILYERGILIK